MAIRDQTYSRYEGPIREKYAWAVIGWTGFRTYLRFLRTKLTFLAVWLIPLIFGIAIVAEYAMRTQLAQVSDGPPGAAGIPGFFQMQIFSLALIFTANGCGIISDDLRHRTIQLYFSKPISKFDYALGKYFTLLLMSFFAVLLPGLILVGLRTAFYTQTDYLTEILQIHGKALLLAILLTAVMSAMVIGLSSLTRRTGYAVLSWIGVLLVPVILHAIVGVASDGSPWASLLSLPGTMNLATQGFLSPEGMIEEVPLFAPFAVLFALLASGLGALYWRISKLEGIA